MYVAHFKGMGILHVYVSTFRLHEAEDRYDNRDSRPEDLELIHQLRENIYEKEEKVLALIVSQVYFGNGGSGYLPVHICGYIFEPKVVSSICRSNILKYILVHPESFHQDHINS